MINAVMKFCTVLQWWIRLECDEGTITKLSCTSLLHIKT